MLKRITTAGVALAALGAFALGGSVIAAAKPHAASHPKLHAAQTAAARSERTDNPAEAPGTTSDGPGGPNVQSGDQSTPDTRSAKAGRASSEGSAEGSSSEADGPGGHQDTGAVNSDTQQQGQN